MRHGLWLWAACVALAVTWPARAADVFEQNLQPGRRVNISGCDPWHMKRNAFVEPISHTLLPTKKAHQP